MMFRIGNPSGGLVLFDGALHGWEAEGSQLLYYYAKWLLTTSDPLAQRILANTCTLIVPVVNIDYYFAGRKNENGVDLNRNFATDWQYSGSTDPQSEFYRGPSPLSEPESQAVAQVFQTRKPSAYVNVHDGGGEVVYASSYTNSTYLSSVSSKIQSLSTQRGVDTYSGPDVIGGPGEALSDAARAGARISLLLELGNGTRTLSEVYTQVLPRFIPIAVVLSQESEGNANARADANKDGKVNMRDILLLIILFNTTPTSSNWNPNADINQDLIVNMIDIVIVIRNFGRTF
jgi:predicted deacylase